MGQAETKEDPIEELCNLLYQKEATKQYDIQKAIKHICQLKQQLDDELTQKAVADRLAEGWGINMLEEWLVFSSPNEEECNLMACATDVFICLLKYEQIADLILGKRLVKSFTTLAFKKPQYAIKGVHMLEQLAANESYQNEMIEQNAIQTFLLLIPTTSDDTVSQVTSTGSEMIHIKEEISLLAMTALFHLAKSHAKKVIENGSINSLIELLMKDPQNISITQLRTVSLCIEVLSCLCSITAVRNRLLSAEVVAQITAKLNHVELQMSVCELISNLCRDEESRVYMKSNIPILLDLARQTVGKLALKARTCLVCVCFCDENFEWLERLNKLDLVKQAMLELNTPEVRYEVANTLERLSTEASIFKQPKLLVEILEPLVKLLDYDDELIILSKATEAIMRLSIRTDMQKHVNEAGATKKLLRIAKKYMPKSSKSSIEEVIVKCIQNTICILCLLTNHFSNSWLLVNRSYIKTLRSVSSMEGDFSIQAEMATITLCSVPEPYSSNSIREKLKHALTGTKSSSSEIVLKAVGVLSILAAEDKNRIPLNRLKGIDTIVALLETSDAGIAGQAAQAISNLLVAPENLELWLKLDTQNICDAANLHIPVRASVGSMSSNRIYEHWGHTFNIGDVIEIQDMPFMEEWTLAFWFLMPIIDTDLQVVVQGHRGVGAILAIINSIFCVIDERSVVHPLVDIKSYKLKNGWHHFALVFSKSTGITAFLKGKEVFTEGSRSIHFSQRMRYFANASEAASPFGTLADIRVYKTELSKMEVEAISKKTKNVVDGLPDRMAEYVNLANGVNMLYRIFIKNENQTKLPVIYALANLATKASLRGSIIRSNFLPLIVSEINSINQSIRFHASRLLVNLG